MKTTTQTIGVMVALLLSSAAQIFAIEGLKLTIICPDVVLSWPGTTGETYIVQVRETLDASSPWVTLTNSLPAQSGTNVTTFVHSNQVDCPSGQVFGMMSGGGMGGSALPMLTAQERKQRLAVQALAQLAAVFEKSQQEGREPYVWELEGRPPLPWEIGSLKKAASGAGTMTKASFTGSNDPQLEEFSGGTPGTGFYRVVRDGVHLFGITNGARLSGVILLPVEFGSTSTGALDQVYLNHTNSDENLHGAVFPEIVPGASGDLTGTWDTARVINGTYTIRLGARLDGGTVVQDVPITVTASNAIWFPDYCDIGGSAIYVGAQTIYTNGAWRLQIYDDSNALVQTEYGPIDGDGYCAWPGVAGPGFSLGNSGASTFYDLVVTAYAPPGSGSSVAPANYYSVATNRVLIEPPWNFTPTTAVTCYQQIFTSVQDGAQEVRDLLETVWNVEQGFHANRLGSSTVPFRTATTNDWSTVLMNLTNSVNRDFFYFGHALGGTLAASSGGGLTIATVNAALANNTTDPLLGTNRHPYRFVFLDGCNTADSNWPQAFGIPKQTGMVAIDFTQKRGIRARAFMGWSRSKQFTTQLTGVLIPSHINYITTFWNTWATLDQSGQRQGVAAAINTAKTAAPVAAGGMVQYGATDLQIDY